MQVAVAACEKTGISSGPVLRTEKHAISIEPVGNVEGLLSLECYVAPGAWGGPVVNGSMAVRGYIVAGTTDPDQPYSLAYASSQWDGFLQGKKPAKPSRCRPAGAESGGAGAGAQAVEFCVDEGELKTARRESQPGSLRAGSRHSTIPSHGARQ